MSSLKRSINNLRSETLNKMTILIIFHRKNTLNICDKVLNLDFVEIKLLFILKSLIFFSIYKI